MTDTIRYLEVRNDAGQSVRCNVVAIEHHAEPGAWIVVIDTGSTWMAAGTHDCVMRRGDLRTPGTFGVWDYLVGPGYIHTKGTFRPDPAAETQPHPPQ